MTREKKLKEIYKIIWTSKIGCEPYTDEPNEVMMIWDVLDYFLNKPHSTEEGHKLVYWRKFKRETIQIQPIEYIDYVFSLIFKKSS